jgi:DNA-binding transcriptional regulator YiaG
VNYKEFEELLNRIGINKKEFAKLTELSYQTVMNWNNTDNVPKWVKSWLENYIEKKNHEKLKQALKDSGVCDNK